MSILRKIKTLVVMSAAVIIVGCSNNPMNGEGEESGTQYTKSQTATEEVRLLLEFCHF